MISVTAHRSTGPISASRRAIELGQYGRNLQRLTVDLHLLEQTTRIKVLIGKHVFYIVNWSAWYPGLLEQIKNFFRVFTCTPLPQGFINHFFMSYPTGV